MARRWSGTEPLLEVTNSIDLYGANVPVPGTSWKIVDFSTYQDMYRLVVEVGPNDYVDISRSPHDGLASVRNQVQMQLVKRSFAS